MACGSGSSTGTDGLTVAQSVTLRRCVTNGSDPASSTHPSFRVLRRLGFVEREAGTFFLIGSKVFDTGRWVPTAAGLRWVRTCAS